VTVLSKVRKMREAKTWQWTQGGVTALLGLIAATFVVVGCGEKDESAEPVATTPASIPTTEEPEPEGPGGGPAKESPAEGGRDGGAEEPGPSAEELAERRAVAAAERAYRRYIAAVNDADGTELCALLDPSFQSELELPVPRGACAERLSASIGYADPSGAPVWKATKLSGIESTIVGKGDRVQLSAAITTEFADRNEPSIESDIVFLEPVGKGERKTYRLMKAPGSLWRAVGQPDIPPSVITPPDGFGGTT
jgi:hypothetical protein